MRGYKLTRLGAAPFALARFCLVLLDERRDGPRDRASRGL